LCKNFVSFSRQVFIMKHLNDFDIISKMMN